MLISSPFLSLIENNQDSFGRCPNGTHKSPSGDCERVTDNKGKPRCPDGFHRSPDGDCERVSNSVRYNDDDDEEEDRDDNDDRKDHNDNIQKDYDLDLPNPDRDEKKLNDFAINDNRIVLGCSYGFYRSTDGNCKPIVSEPTVSVDMEDNDEKKDINSVSISNKSETDDEGLVFANIDKSNSFFDHRNNRNIPDCGFKRNCCFTRQKPHK